MADIFQEVDEDIRRERALRLWAAYGRYVIGAAVLIVLAVAGWRYWQSRQEAEAQAAGARFEQALQLGKDGKAAEQTTALQAMAGDGPAGYRVLARFRLAAQAAETDAAAGAKAFDDLAIDAGLGEAARDIARMRAAALVVDTAPYADMQARVEALSSPSSAWRHVARELLGLSAWRAKNMAAATRWYEMLLADSEAPTTLRQRAQTMMQLIAEEQPVKAG